ncbi:hypothetical protein QJS10_CPB15g01847 [Acorus calamus]|uniref:GB1/RHD3-type G domain-containing protein n=1 Tax=Acorus calamus TaxID=4465 RepID=A0AAV9D6I3_ACOCL|nr:hypothetical protein QJS10_CPB15g01847 [Acorus calamus]
MGFSTQLIDGDGEFNNSGVESFMKSVKLAECGFSYRKSTLLNHLFGTDFKEMDALQGRNQTTKGIWIAKAVGIKPCTIIMDVEGTDGSERGEDDKFERWSTLFSMAISDIVMINIWYHDIGREYGANKPLLKIVFQVMMELFNPRKTTLLFVIRDKSKTPLNLLEQKLKDEIQKIRVTALPNFEEREEQFKKEVIELQKKFSLSIDEGGYANAREIQHAIPASTFSTNALNIWEDIRAAKNLDLSEYRKKVVDIRCQEIADELLKRLSSKKMEKRSDTGLSFASWLQDTIDTYKQDYDKKTIQLDKDVRNKKRRYLEDQVLKLKSKYWGKWFVKRTLNVVGLVMTTSSLVTTFIDGGMTGAGGLAITGVGAFIGTDGDVCNLTEAQIRNIVDQVFQDAA